MNPRVQISTSCRITSLNWGFDFQKIEFKVEPVLVKYTCTLWILKLNFLGTKPN